MSNNEEIYLKALKDILEHGELRKTRNSYTLYKFSVKMDFDISKDFPLLTT
jgi:thymidylate synthase